MATTLTINGVGYSFPQTGDENWGDNVTAWAAAVTGGMLQKAGGTFTLSAEIDFGATFGIKTAYIKSRAANPGSAGVLRLGNAENISWRNNANNGDVTLSVNASDEVTVGGVPLQKSISVFDTPTIDLGLSGGTTISASVKDDSISDNHISSSAAIAYSKLALASSIVNADISNSAAIAYSKLSLSNSIVNADISSSAAIAYSKLALTGTLVNSDISSSAAIAYSKLALAGSIVNADISASAAIALSKLQTLTANQVLSTNGSGQIVASSTTVSELNALSGIGGNIQGQFDAQAALITTNSTKLTNVVAPSGSAAFRIDSVTGGFLGPRLTTIERDALSSPATGLEIFNTTAGKKQIYTGSAWQDVGSGSGGSKNYITGGDGEQGAIGTTYADGAAVPVDGAGGTPTLVNSYTGLLPLSGLQSLNITPGALGNGVAFSFTPDREDLGTVLAVNLSYEIATPANYTDGDLQVWIVHPSGRVEQPSAYKIMKAIGPAKTQPITFQTETTSGTYKILLHQTTATTSWGSFKFEISCGPQVKSVGPVISDAVSKTFTLTNAGNATVTGTVAQIGENGLFSGTITIGSTVPTGTIQVNLPAGYTFASNGYWAKSDVRIYDANPTFFTHLGSAYINSSTSFIFNGHAALNWNATTPITFAAGDVITFYVEAKVQGWSSNQVLSSDSSGRPVAFTVSNASGGLTSSATTVSYSTTSVDTLGGWSTNKYVIKESGLYRFFGVHVVQSTAATSAYVDLRVAKIAGDVEMGFSRTQFGSVTIDTCRVETPWFSLSAGDEIQITQSCVGFTTPSYNRSQFWGEKFNTTGQQIAATEEVTTLVSSTLTTAINSSGAPIPWNQTEYDSHGSMNLATGVWTCQRPGRYRIHGSLHILATLTTSQPLTARIFKNGSMVAFGNVLGTGASNDYCAKVTRTLNLVQGDQILLNGYCAIAANLSGNTAGNYLSIESVK